MARHLPARGGQLHDTVGSAQRWQTSNTCRGRAWMPGEASVLAGVLGKLLNCCTSAASCAGPFWASPLSTPPWAPSPRSTWPWPGRCCCSLTWCWTLMRDTPWGTRCCSRGSDGRQRWQRWVPGCPHPTAAHGSALTKASDGQERHLGVSCNGLSVCDDEGQRMLKAA